MRRQGEEGVIRSFAGGSPEWSWEVAQVAHSLTLSPQIQSPFLQATQSHTNDTIVK